MSVMPKSVDAREQVNAYIAALPGFSKQICEKLRTIILDADSRITEEWKWGPHYSYKGMVCGFGAFQQHVKLTFFNGSGMKDKDKLFNHCVDNEFSRSVKYTSVEEIDEMQLIAYVRESMQTNEEGFKRVIKNKAVDVPEALTELLSSNTKAKQFFETLSYGYKKEFVDWINTAKRIETRKERMEKTVAMCAAEKKLNDKYKA
jgi:hypothetical protein